MPHAIVPPVVALAAGIAAGVLVLPDPRAAAGVLVLTFLGSLVVLRRRMPRTLMAVALAGWAAAGVALGSAAEADARRPRLVQQVQRLPADAPVHVVGRLREDAASFSSGVSLRLDVESVGTGARLEPGHGGIAVTVSGALATARLHEWTAGRRLRLPARLRPPAQYLNPGVPDHRLALARRGTVLAGSVKSAALVEVIAPGGWSDELAAAVRKHVRARVNAAVGAWSPQSAAIVVAVLIGDRAGLGEDVERRLQEAGTYHVIAISGGNIAVFAVCLLALARFLRLPWRAGLAATAVGLAAYGEIAAGGSSVSRAIAVALVYVGGCALDQRGSAASALGAAALFILCAAPLSLLDAGFLLTFGATIGILVGVPRVAAVFPARGFLSAVVALTAASAASELALLPVGAYFFSRVTLAGLVLNLAAVPLMSLVQIGGMAVVALDAIHPDLATAAAWLPHSAAEGLVRSAALVQYVPWLTWRVAAPPPWLVAGYYSVLAASLLRRRLFGWMAPHERVVAWRLVSACNAAAAVLVMLAPLHAGVDGTAGRVRLTVLDVGQGDATLVQTPAGHALLIDAGGLGGQARFDVGERVVAPALWALGVRRLDTLVVTHGDPDHAGGAPALVAMLRPRELWEGVPVPGHPPLVALAHVARTHRLVHRQVRAGDLVDLGGITIGVLHPPAPDWERQRVRNDDSVVLDVRVGDVSVILPGDVGAAVEESLVPALSPARVRVLKVAHHGSATSTSQAFLEALRPEVAIVSCGRDNRFGHPVPAVLARLERAGAAVYRTDRHGAVTVETDGSAVQVRTWR